MLFDQEANKLQMGFDRLGWIKFTGLNAGVASFETSTGMLEISTPGTNMFRLRLQRAPAPDYGILVEPEMLARESSHCSGLKASGCRRRSPRMVRSVDDSRMSFPRR